MKKLVFIFFVLFPSLGWGVVQTDTLRPNGNGTFNNWDDNNTAGCAATASNYLRVNTNSRGDTLSVDVIAGVCNNGDQFTSHNLAPFTSDHNNIDTVRIQIFLTGTVATDSARIGMVLGTDSIWSSRFVLTGSDAMYEFASATDPHGNPWEKITVDSLETAVHSKLGTNGRIWDTEEIAVVVYTVETGPPPPGAPGPTSAVRFYFPSSGASPANIAFGFGLSTKWNDTTQASIQGWRNKLVATTHSNTAMTSRTDSSTAASSEFHCLGQWISDPLANQYVSGSFKGQRKGRQSATGLNGTIAYCVYLIKKDGTLIGLSLPLTASDNTAATPPEMSTTTTNRRFLNASETTPVTMTPFGVPDSARLVVELGFRDSSTSTTQNSLARIGDPTDSTDLLENDTQTSNGAPWIQSSTPIIFYNTASCDKQDTLLPVSSSASGTWVEPAIELCSPSANDWDYVNDGFSHDGDAEYLECSGVSGGGCGTGAGQDSVNIADFSPAGLTTIDSVRLEAWIKRVSGAAADSVRLIMKTTTEAVQPAQTITTAYARYVYTRSTNPAGGVWTDAAVDSLRALYHGFPTSSTTDLRLTSIYYVVFWTDNTCAAGDNRRRRLLTGEKETDWEEKNEELARKSPTFMFRADSVFVK